MDTVNIAINCDVGEGVGNEAELFKYISSCNIACGGHAGDALSMRKIARMAVQHGVRVGAHPSYPDRQNFGRVTMKMPTTALVESIERQMGDFTAILEAERIPLHHIKPHGALYNDLAIDVDLANTFLDAIHAFKHMAYLYVPYGSKIEKQALKQNFSLRYEAFADRNYEVNLSLVSRKKANALITDPETVLQHLLFMVRKGKVRTPEGVEISLKADTFCIHGDTPSALKILMYLSDRLPSYGVSVLK